MRFGANKRFYEKLKEKGWTFAQLSERLCGAYTANTLFQYADGRKTPNKADKKKIAEAFGCLVTDIF
ncbi:MAG: helix-turn-helix transcriptional regulator [Clostridia bacterium]|nr:helix-turn-helix transcriptional regulator [Clostridia bacterium]